jgi:hypothetical protein
MQEQLTEADKIWFDLPVTARVEPDNQRWLDTLMEMKKDELVSFGIYNYSIPAVAINALAELNQRSEIIQMIITANAAGESGMTADHRYRYLSDMPANVPTAVSVKPGGRKLYLTRGNDESMQVFVAQPGNEQGGEWQAYAKVRVGYQPEIVPAANAASTAAVITAPLDSRTPPAVPAAPALPTGIDVGVLIPMMPKMRRADLVNIAKQMGLTSVPLEPTDDYPDNASVRDAIEQRYIAQGGKLPEQAAEQQQAPPANPPTAPSGDATNKSGQEG